MYAKDVVEAAQRAEYSVIVIDQWWKLLKVYDEEYQEMFEAALDANYILVSDFPVLYETQKINTYFYVRR